MRPSSAQSAQRPLCRVALTACTVALAILGCLYLEEPSSLDRYADGYVSARAAVGVGDVGGTEASFNGVPAKPDAGAVDDGGSNGAGGKVGVAVVTNVASASASASPPPPPPPPPLRSSWGQPYQPPGRRVFYFAVSHPTARELERASRETWGSEVPGMVWFNTEVVEPAWANSTVVITHQQNKYNQIAGRMLKIWSYVYRHYPDADWCVKRLARVVMVKPSARRTRYPYNTCMYS